VQPFRRDQVETWEIRYRLLVPGDELP